MPQFVEEIPGDLPRNIPLDMGKALLLSVIKKDMHGKLIWVSGNEFSSSRLEYVRPNQDG